MNKELMVEAEFLSHLKDNKATVEEWVKIKIRLLFKIAFFNKTILFFMIFQTFHHF